jgi:hypothetical protein
MVLTDGGFTVLVKRWLSTGKTRDQQTFKSCALAGMWTGRWGLQEAIFRAVDFTGAIDFNESQLWTSSNGLTVKIEM